MVSIRETLLLCDIYTIWQEFCYVRALGNTQVLPITQITLKSLLTLALDNVLEKLFTIYHTNCRIAPLKGKHSTMWLIFNSNENILK